MSDFLQNRSMCPSCKTGTLNRRSKSRLICSFCNTEFLLSYHPPLDEKALTQRAKMQEKDELWSSNLLMKRKFIIPTKG